MVCDPYRCQHNEKIAHEVVALTRKKQEESLEMVSPPIGLLSGTVIRGAR